MRCLEGSTTRKEVLCGFVGHAQRDYSPNALGTKEPALSTETKKKPSHTACIAHGITHTVRHVNVGCEAVAAAVTTSPSDAITK